MPGIPKSTACAPCKRRRTKCDQNWPACSQCIRKKLVCPGPSSLMKFIHSSPDEINQDSGPSEGHRHSTVASSARAFVVWDERLGLLNNGKRPVKDGVNAQFRKQLSPSPGPKITSDGDRAAARLINHLQSAPHRGMVLQAKYLKHLPKCLEKCPSLRDSIDLFCSVWQNYRRGKIPDSFAHMPEYARAVRSLRYTLTRGDEALTVETLASITILGRTEYLFSSGKNAPSVIHELGIGSLNERLGPPKPGDELHASLVSENYMMLVPFWIMTNGKFFMAEGPWREATTNGMAEIFEQESLRPYIKDSFEASCRVCCKTSQLLGNCRTIQNSSDRYSPQMIAKAQALMKELNEEVEATADSNSKLFEKAQELELVEIEDDPDSVTGTRYRFLDINLCQMLLSWLSVEIHILKMLHDCSIIYPKFADPTALWTRFRNLSLHVWNFIPNLLELESFVAVTSQTVLYPTIEAANREERGYLLDAFARMDRFRQTLPTDRALLESAILSNAMLFTGRKPITQGAKRGGACDGSFTDR